MTIQLPTADLPHIATSIIGGSGRAHDQMYFWGVPNDAIHYNGTTARGALTAIHDGKQYTVRYRTRGIPLQRPNPNSAWLATWDVTGADGTVQITLGGKTYDLTDDDAAALDMALNDAITEARTDGTSDDDHDAHLDRIGVDR